VTGLCLICFGFVAFVGVCPDGEKGCEEEDEEV